MWQRFNERARRIIFFAQEETRRTGESSVLPGHLMLGLLREGQDTAGPDTQSIACLALINQSVSLSVLERELRARFPDRARPSGLDQILSREGKEVISRAYQEAQALKHDYIGEEHILLGLIAVEDPHLSELFNAFFVTLDAVRTEVSGLAANRSTVEKSVVPPPRISSVLDASKIGGPGPAERAERLLELRQRSWPADRFCLALLLEGGEAADRAIQGVGGKSADIAFGVRDILAKVDSLTMPGAKIRLTDLVDAAREDAGAFGQAVSGAHFLAAVARFPDSAFAQTFAKNEITYESLRDWIQANPA